MTPLKDRAKAVEFLLRSGLMPYMAVAQLLVTLALVVLVIKQTLL